MSDHLFLKDRIQHSLHSCFHILDRLIDYAVQPHIYLLPVSDGLGRRVRTDVKSDNDRVGSGGQRYVGLVDGSHAAVDHLDHDLLVGQLLQTLLNRLYRTLNIRLYDDRKFFYVSGLDLGEQIVQRQLRLRILKKLILSFSDEGFRKASRFLFIGQRHKDLSGIGNVV